jgi:hypothetical protein
MGIVSSQIIEDKTQADGTRHVRFQHEFHTGEVVVRPQFIASSGYDANAGLAADATVTEQLMIDNEDENFLGQVESEVLAAIDAQPVHPDTDTAADRQKRLRRKLARWAARHEDLKWVRRVFYPIWYWLKFDSGFNAPQIRNYLNISTAQFTKINNRFQAIHDNLAMIDADDSYLEDID